jgi:hypothetical protein
MDKYIVILFVVILLFLDLKWGIVADIVTNIYDGDHSKYIACNLYSGLVQFWVKLKHIYLNVPLNREVCGENLLILNQVLNEVGIPYWLSEGTALGIVRDSDFIEWDDDVDISFMIEHRDIFIEKAFPVLCSRGFTFCGTINNGNFFTFMRRGERIDIDIVEPNKSCIAPFTRNTKHSFDCNIIINNLHNMRHIEFLGTTFNVPGDDYLEALYGSNWRTPSKNK